MQICHEDLKISTCPGAKLCFSNWVGESSLKLQTVFFAKLHVLQELLLKTYNSDVVKPLHQCRVLKKWKCSLGEPRGLLFEVVTVWNTVCIGWGRRQAFVG